MSECITASIVQMILFAFAGALFISSIVVYIKNRPSKNTIAFLTSGTILAIIAAVNPYNITEMVANKEGLSIKRQQPFLEQKERTTNTSQVAFNTPPVDIPAKEKPISGTKRYSDEKRFPIDYLVLAIEKRQTKQYDEALMLAFVGLNLNPQDSRVKASLLDFIGSIYSKSDAHNLAIKYYKDAIQEDPKFSFPHNNLGNIYYILKRYQEAEEEYKKAVELDPKDAFPHNNLGNIYSDLKRYQEAEEEYKKAIELDPKCAHPHYGLGNVYCNLKRYQEAEEEYKKAIELDPKYADPHYTLGNIYYNQEKYSKAEEEFKKAIELDPKYTSPHNNLGSVYSVLKRYQEAEEEYKRAIELDQRYALAYKNLGILYQKLSRPEEAEKMFQKANELESQ